MNTAEFEDRPGESPAVMTNREIELELEDIAQEEIILSTRKAALEREQAARATSGDKPPDTAAS